MLSYLMILYIITLGNTVLILSEITTLDIVSYDFNLLYINNSTGHWAAEERKQVRPRANSGGYLLGSLPGNL